MTYTFANHLHNYAVWTAARAVQRDFTTTANISQAIANTDLHRFEDLDINSEEKFKEFHIRCATQLITTLTELKAKAPTYGRAAKIISIYLKTTVILKEQGEGKLSNLIHPPIDGILLKAIAKNKKRRDMLEKGWTKLDEKDYWILADKLREIFGEFNWKLEEHWKPELEKKKA
jgi:hypothetical protein